MAAVNTLCSADWLTLLTWILLVLSNWYASRTNFDDPRIKLDVSFYRSYETARRHGWIVNFSSEVFHGITTAIYVFIVPAFFLYSYHEDSCTAATKFTNGDLITATWILVIINIIGSRLWNAAFQVNGAKAYRVAFALVLVEALTSIVLTVLFFILASTKKQLYYSASVFVVYSLWNVYAAYVNYTLIGESNAITLYMQKKRLEAKKNLKKK